MIRHYLGDGCEDHAVGDFDDVGSASPPTADVPTDDEWPEYAADAWNLIRREAVPYVPLFSARIAERAVRELDAAGMLRRPTDHSGVAGEPEATTKEASEIDSAVPPTQLPVPTPDGPAAADVAGGVVVPDEAVEAGAEALRSRQWNTPPDHPDIWRLSEHRNHTFDARCAVCAGEVNEIAPVVLTAATPLIAAQALREMAGRFDAAGDEIKTYEETSARGSFTVRGSFEIGMAWKGAARELRNRADELERGSDR